MRIGIIGAGMIGGTAAKLFADAGHEIAISNRRGPEAIAGLLSELGPRAHWLTTEDSARWADVVLLAVPFRTPEALPPPELVAGKIVIDAMNPYASSGGMLDLKGSSSSEETSKRLPGARLVKAFNTIYFRHLETQGNADAPEDERRAIFVAGDDVEAKRLVGDLIRQIGFAPVDTGSLAEGGRRQEPGTAIYNRDLTEQEARAELAGK
jgi:predicted dinucleotide-binding enzyme